MNVKKNINLTRYVHQLILLFQIVVKNLILIIILFSSRMHAIHS